MTAKMPPFSGMPVLRCSIRHDRATLSARPPSEEAKEEREEQAADHGEDPTILRHGKILRLNAVRSTSLSASLSPAENPEKERHEKAGEHGKNAERLVRHRVTPVVGTVGEAGGRGRSGLLVVAPEEAEKERQEQPGEDG